MVRSELANYSVAARNTAPVVIGGIGGSGTRLVTQILAAEGVRFGGDMNESLDNLWFSLLFVRKTIFLKSAEQQEQMIWLFVNAMREGHPVPEELLPILEEAARFDRGPALRKTVLEAARDTMLQLAASRRDESPMWGWKQPNTHVLVPILAKYLPQMKYIYVVRNGLDMAFSYNQNQLKYFWGDLMIDGDVAPTPRNSLRYWVACYQRICGDRALLGDRLYILDFDLLCRQPVQQVGLLNQFLDLAVSETDLATAVEGITVPDSSGRHKQEDCSQLRQEDIEFVRNLGFEVPLLG